MLYTDLTKKAMQIAYDAHYGQTDRGNTPYICHPLHVADSMPTEKRCCLALLHDVLEDTEETAESLIQKGIPKEIVEKVLVLTRRKDEAYDDYISRIIDSGDQDVIAVKLADITHNLDITRTEHKDLPERLLTRYHKARARLEPHLMRSEGE